MNEKDVFTVRPVAAGPCVGCRATSDLFRVDPGALVACRPCIKRLEAALRAARSGRVK